MKILLRVPEEDDGTCDGCFTDYGSKDCVNIPRDLCENRIFKKLDSIIHDGDDMYMLVDGVGCSRCCIKPNSEVCDFLRSDYCSMHRVFKKLREVKQ